MTATCRKNCTARWTLLMFCDDKASPASMRNDEDRRSDRQKAGSGPSHWPRKGKALVQVTDETESCWPSEPATVCGLSRTEGHPRPVRCQERRNPTGRQGLSQSRNFRGSPWNRVRRLHELRFGEGPIACSASASDSACPRPGEPDAARGG